MKRKILTGIIWLLASVFLLLSIISANYTTLVGAFGKGLGSFLISVFGFASYLFVALFILLGICNVSGIKLQFKTRQKWALLIGFVACCWALDFIPPSWLLAGGALGDFINAIVRIGLGLVGDIIVLVGLAFATYFLGFYKSDEKIIAQHKTEPVPAQTQESSPVASPDTSEPKTEPSVCKEASVPLPPLELLSRPPQLDVTKKQKEFRDNAQIIENTLKEFGIETRISQIVPGPVVTRYEIRIAPGVKLGKIVNLKDELALNLKAHSLRILAPIPGKAAVGIEIPNIERDVVWLRELLESPEYKGSSSLLTIALGKTTIGQEFVTDLASMPHLLIAGATGSGKSVCIHSIIMSILYKAHSDQVKFILIDPKRVELPVYNDIPHLVSPVVLDAHQAAEALGWVIAEMERRYELLAKKGVRDIDTYNQREEHLPYIVVIIDELADLMVVSQAKVEHRIMHLAQMSRAVGIHLVLATQRPSVDVITGVIKANLPTRIAFQVTSKVDSRTILDANGAEDLLGRGDMLFLPPDSATPTRLQGSFISNEEVERITSFIKDRSQPQYEINEFMTVKEEPIEQSQTGSKDELYPQAVRLVIEQRYASVSYLQRRLAVGYNRAARMIESMEADGVVGPQQGAKPRAVLVGLDYLEQLNKPLNL